VTVSLTNIFQHLTSYPVVSDSIETYKRNPYGAKSLVYADSGYTHFVKPVLPYAQRPYSIVSPYVTKADSMAAHGLDRVDATFPLLTKDTATIKDTAWSYALFPLHKADETRSYVLGTWGQHYKSYGGNGVVAGGRALVTTGLTVSSDLLAAVTSFLGQKKTQAETAIKEKKAN